MGRIETHFSYFRIPSPRMKENHRSVSQPMNASDNSLTHTEIKEVCTCFQSNFVVLRLKIYTLNTISEQAKLHCVSKKLCNFFVGTLSNFHHL